MTYTSFLFWGLFLPITLTIYHFLPSKWRSSFLLLANLCLYFIWTKKWLLLHLLTVLWVYILIRCLEYVDKLDILKKKKENYKKVIVGIGIVGILSLLIYLKYWNFLISLFSPFLSTSKYIRQLAMPLGISYYSLQLISLLVDCKTKKVVKPTFKQILLYTTFFGTVVLGPITRFQEVIYQLIKGEDIKWLNIKQGTLRIIWGIMKKMVLADSIAPIVALIFKSYAHQGSVVVLGAFLCTMQIYMDFSGAIDMAIGAARLFGIILPENFKQPFFAKNAADFWRRWHITLGHFFRDYIFYPVSLSKPIQKLSKWIRKKLGKEYARLIGPFIALLAVWLANGLWHGPQWTYIVYGLYYFVLILLELILEKPMQKFYHKMNWEVDGKVNSIFRFFKLLIIVCFGEMMFLSNSLLLTKQMLISVITNFHLVDIYTFFKAGAMPFSQCLAIVIGFVGVIIYNISEEKQWHWRSKYQSLPFMIKGLLLYILLMYIVIFACYGPGFDTIAMMYAGF